MRFCHRSLPRQRANPRSVVHDGPAAPGSRFAPPGCWRFCQDDKEGSSRQRYRLSELWLRISKCGIENGTELITLERGTG